MDPNVMAMLQKSISAKLCPTVIGRCQVLPSVIGRCQAPTSLVGDKLSHREELPYVQSSSYATTSSSVGAYLFANVNSWLGCIFI